MARNLANLSPERAARLKVCGAWLAFKHYLRCGEVRLAKANFCCQYLLCPFCAFLRAMKRCARYFDRFKLVWASKRFYGASMVTLTLRDGADLAERLGRLTRAFQGALNRRRDVLKGKSSSEFGAWAGGVSSVEIKRGSGSGLWHPHMHVLVLQDRWIDARLLQDEWSELVGEEAHLDIVALKGVARGDEEQVRKSFLEVFKYAVKFGSMTPDDTWAAFQVARGRRLLRPFGCMWGVPDPENLTDESLEGEPFEWLFYRFIEGDVSYSLR